MHWQRYTWISVVVFISVFSGISISGELREVEYLFFSETVVWEMEPTHVVCDECPSLKDVRVAPRGYAEKVVRIKDFHPSVREMGSITEEKREVRLTVYFDFDSYSLRDGEYLKLREFARSFDEGDYGLIDIHGYTCDIGSEEYNDLLATRRAESVYEALRGLGVPEKRMRFGGKGRCCYVSSERARNRRVEVILYKRVHERR